VSGNPCVICQRSTDAFLCWECSKRLRKTLESVPWLDENLEVTVSRQDQLGKVDTVKAKASETPLVFNDGASEFRRGLRDTVTRWVRDLCESRGVQFKHIDCDCTHPERFVGPLRPGERRERCHLRPITTSDLSRWLAHNVVAIMHSEDAQLCYGEITLHVEKAVEWINRPEPPVYRGPCPTVIGEDRGRPIYCATDLYAEKGSAFAKCPRCKSSHDVYEIEQSLLDHMDDILMSAAEILRVTRELGVPIPRNRFYGWRKDGKIQPRAYRRRDGRITDRQGDEDDSPLFRLGDARRLRDTDRMEEKSA
jgi:hypothetical protein